LLIILAAISSAGSQLLENIPLALPAVITTVVIMLSLGYMMGQTLNMPPVISWVKIELRELIVSLILFVIVFSLFSASTAFVTTLTGETNYQAAAKVTINDMTARAIDAYNQALKAYHAIWLNVGYNSNLAVGFYVMVTTAGAPHSGYAPYLQFLGQATAALTNMIFLYGAMNAFLDFFIAIGPKMLWLAFAFRIVPFTRSLGTTLIALTIGAYILFPMSLVLVDNFHKNVIDVPNPKLSPAVFSELEFTFPPGADFICGDFFTRILFGLFGEIGFSLPICIAVAIATLGVGFQPCWEAMTRIVYPLITNVAIPLTWGTILAVANFTTPSVEKIYDDFKEFLADVNGLVVVSYVDLIIVAIITVVGTRSISVALGGEYLLPGIQKMV
jgi:hypothetical protein